MTPHSKPENDRYLWQHKKRGSVYRVLFTGCPMQEEQTEGRRLDDEPMVVYQSIDTGKVFVRPVVEFYDGRFENVGVDALAQAQPSLADWSSLPRDLYVTSVKSADGIVFDVRCCSVPMAIGPEVRYSAAFPAVQAKPSPEEFDEHEVEREPMEGDVPLMTAKEFRGDRPLGTPISELSSQPGDPSNPDDPRHAGYAEFCRIARSWGYD